MSLTEASLGADGANRRLHPEFHEVAGESALHIISADRPYAEAEADLLMRLHELRLDFVKGMGWIPDAADDWDAYDGDHGTHYFIVEDALHSETVTAGMRMTPVDSVEGSLSWSMLNEEMAAAARAKVGTHGESLITHLDEAAKSGNLWDLTRLVNPLDGSVDIETIKDNLLMMFGAAFAKTTELNADPREVQWIFTTTRDMKVALDRLGIRSVPLTKGRISAHDNLDSYFCAANPFEDLAYIQHKPGYEHTRDMVMRGLQKASAL